MKIKTQITETVERVSAFCGNGKQVPIPHGSVNQGQLSKEVKKQKATVTLEVDQDFADLMNFFGEVTQADFVQMGCTKAQYQIVATLWNKVHNNTELRTVLNFDYQRGFTMKQQVQSEQ